MFTSEEEVEGEDSGGGEDMPEGMELKERFRSTEELRDADLASGDADNEEAKGDGGERGGAKLRAAEAMEGYREEDGDTKNDEVGEMNGDGEGKGTYPCSDEEGREISIVAPFSGIHQGEIGEEHDDEHTNSGGVDAVSNGTSMRMKEKGPDGGVHDDEPGDDGIGWPCKDMIPWVFILLIGNPTRDEDKTHKA